MIDVGQQPERPMRQRQWWLPETLDRWWNLHRWESLTPKQIEIGEKGRVKKGEIEKAANARTIARYVKDRSRQEGEPWSPMSASAEVARLVLPVLGHVANLVQQTPEINKAEASCIAHVRLICPDIMTEAEDERALDVFLLGIDYASRERTKVPTDDLDTFLTWAPWQRQTDAQKSKRSMYETLVENGGLPGARFTRFLEHDFPTHGVLQLLRERLRARREAEQEFSARVFGATRRRREREASSLQQEEFENTGSGRNEPEN